MAATSSDHPDRTKPNTGLNPIRKVRVVAKIRAFTDVEFESFKGVSKPWISVHKSKGELSESAAISFGDQSTSRRETYEVDYCYEQHEDNCLIFSREIKPLISEVFDGRDLSIIAYGARGSGKTYTIQGSDEKPGLALLAMDEIISRAQEVGKSVTISYYEVYQDHVYDLLDQKQLAVLVLEDAKGRIQLKGLSQVSVKSFSEFQKLYLNGCVSHKPTQKIASEFPRRSHKGLMVHVSSCDDNSNNHLVGKMNFVDLAGYEDSRRKSSDGSNLVENTRINKSLYALQNVVYALNANENHVPYRESRLTRMLQGSLGGTNQILMITCLNPSFCQDTIYTVSLASRSCQGINQAFMDSTKKSKSSARPKVLYSSKLVKRTNGSTDVKKQTGSRLPLPERQHNGSALAMKGRKLFDEANQLKNSEQANSSSDSSLAIVPYLQKEVKSISDVSKATAPLEEEVSSLIALTDAYPTAIVVKDDSQQCVNNGCEVTPTNNSSMKAFTSLEEDHNIDKENKSSFVNEGGSPPISARLQELSNNLKLLYSSTPSYIEMPQENNSSSTAEVSSDIMELKTPVLEKNLRVNDKWEVANINSPWETFNIRSSGMKNSLVQDYMKFLNTASKEELKGLKGIGEKRATYILELRNKCPEPFKNLDDLKDIGLSEKQINGMMKKVAGDLFS